MTLIPYLFFNGTCGEAMDFYKSVFGGELFKLTFEQSKQNMPKEFGDWIMHSTLTNGEIRIQASDSPPQFKQTPGGSVVLNIQCESADELDETFAKLSVGGSALEKPQDAFWGARFARLKDQFGTSWMLNYDKNSKA